MNLKYFKKQHKWTLVALLAVIVLVYLAYNCVPENKEYFVVKAQSPMGEVLLDQTDFAEIINGLKPKHVKGDFTADDLSELVRELKKNATRQFNKDCENSENKKHKCDPIGMYIVSLIDETNKRVTGKMKKSEWIDAMIVIGRKMYVHYQTADARKLKRDEAIAIDFDEEDEEPDISVDTATPPPPQPIPV